MQPRAWEPEEGMRVGKQDRGTPRTCIGSCSGLIRAGKSHRKLTLLHGGQTMKLWAEGMDVKGGAGEMMGSEGQLWKVTPHDHHSSARILNPWLTRLLLPSSSVTTIRLV